MLSLTEDETDTRAVRMQFLRTLVAATPVTGPEDAKQNKEWKVANGEWKMQKGIYQEVSGGESAMHSIVGDVKWDNYTVEAKVRLDKGNWAGLLFRAQNELSLIHI